MSLGPVDFVAVRFPDNQLRGESLPALMELVDAGTIRIIDLVFARKDAEGNVDIVELHDLDDETYTLYESLVGDVNGMLSRDDVELISSALEPNTSGGLMLIENTWARRFVEALQHANAEVLISERVPRAAIEELIAAQAEA